MMETKDKITCDFLYYQIRGNALIEDWYGTIGSIEMTPSIVNNLADIPNVINDNGYGAQIILGAKVHVFAVYGFKTGYKGYPGYTPLKFEVDTMYISLDPENPILPDKYKKFLDENDSIDIIKKFKG